MTRKLKRIREHVADWLYDLAGRCDPLIEEGRRKDRDSIELLIKYVCEGKTDGQRVAYWACTDPKQVIEDALTKADRDGFYGLSPKRADHDDATGQGRR